MLPTSAKDSICSAFPSLKKKRRLPGDLRRWFGDRIGHKPKPRSAARNKALLLSPVDPMWAPPAVPELVVPHVQVPKPKRVSKTKLFKLPPGGSIMRTTIVTCGLPSRGIHGTRGNVDFLDKHCKIDGLSLVKSSDYEVCVASGSDIPFSRCRPPLSLYEVAEHDLDTGDEGSVATCYSEVRKNLPAGILVPAVVSKQEHANKVIQGLYAQRPYVEINLYGLKKAELLWDTGAHPNILSLSLFRQISRILAQHDMSIPTIDARQKLTTYGGTVLENNGCALISFYLGKNVFRNIPFMLVDSPAATNSGILGMQFINLTKASWTWEGEELHLTFAMTVPLYEAKATLRGKTPQLD